MNNSAIWSLWYDMAINPSGPKTFPHQIINNHGTDYLR